MINTEYQLIDGVVQTTYDPTWGGVVSIDGFVNDLVDGIKNLLDKIKDKKGDLTEDEIEDFQQKGEDFYGDINNQIDKLIADGKLTKEEADKLKDTLKESQDAFDSSLIASTDDSIVSQAIKASEIAEEKLKKVQEAINSAKNNSNNTSKELKIYYCDSIVKLGKKNNIIKTCNKLKFLYQKVDSTTTKTVDLQLKIATSDGTKDKVYPSKNKWKSVKYNENWEVDFDSIPSGEYSAQLKVNDSIYKYEFTMHKKCTSGNCCRVCDRDLTINLTKLKKIFEGSKSKKLTTNTATIFTKALKEGGFTTCKQHAHFFSQIILECNNFKDFKEGSGYRLLNIYDTFGGQTGNDTRNSIFSIFLG